MQYAIRKAKAKERIKTTASSELEMGLPQGQRRRNNDYDDDDDVQRIFFLGHDPTFLQHSSIVDCTILPKAPSSS
jgi:hypothetical protein